jgi:hypothetical protein
MRAIANSWPGHNHWTFAIVAVTPLLIAWAVVFAAVPASRQEFSLNDDSAYSASLFGLLSGHGIDYFDWASSPQLGMWAWAAPFCLALGQSLVATRLSTIVLSILGTLALFDLLRREVGLESVRAAIGCLLFALNPLVFMLAGSYMTDVPALSMSLIALALFTRGLDTPSWPMLMLSTAFAVAAVSTRQNAIVVPVVMAYLTWLRPTRRAGKAPLVVAGGVFVCALATAYWFGTREDVVRYVPQVPTVDHAIRVIASLLMYLGVFVVPAAALTIQPRDIRKLLWPTAGVLAMALAWVAYLRFAHGRTLLEGGVFPYTGNMLTAFGSFGTSVVLGSRPVVMSESMRIGLTLVGCIGSGWLIIQAMRRARQGWPDALSLFGLLHVPFLFISMTFFDRYVVTFLPTALGLILWGTGEPSTKVNRLLSATLGVAMACSAVMLVHDWYAWNAARWELGRQALAQGVPAAEIEGGFEWDHFHAIREGRWRGETQIPAGLTLPFNAAYFAGLKGKCGLSFDPVPDTMVVASTTYNSWIGRQRHDFFLVCR